MYYDYREEMSKDLINAIADNYTLEELIEKLDDPDSFREELNDSLWIDDSVTGNASGSYFFNSWKSKEAVTDNMDLLKEAISEFCIEAETVAEKFIDEEWEYFDVTIRCYILYGEVDELVDALVDCLDALKAENKLTAESLVEILEAA